MAWDAETTVDEISNGERAERGEEILRAYRAKHGEDDDHTIMADVLADLMHYASSTHGADKSGVDFYEALILAEAHYKAEESGEE